jgi:hypothetical protein
MESERGTGQISEVPLRRDRDELDDWGMMYREVVSGELRRLFMGGTVSVPSDLKFRPIKRNGIQNGPAPFLRALTDGDCIIVILVSFGADLSFARPQRFCTKDLNVSRAKSRSGPSLRPRKSEGWLLCCPIFLLVSGP